MDQVLRGVVFVCQGKISLDPVLNEVAPVRVSYSEGGVDQELGHVVSVYHTHTHPFVFTNSR